MLASLSSALRAHIAAAPAQTLDTAEFVVLGEASLAWTMEAGVEDLAHAIHAHPTFPEAVGEAALVAMGMGLHAV